MIKEMREPTFLVLATLAEGKKHGNAIIQGVASLSEGEVELKAGTLYAMLDRLTVDGVIELVGAGIGAGGTTNSHPAARRCSPKSRNEESRFLRLHYAVFDSSEVSHDARLRTF